MGNASSNPGASADEGLEPYEYFVTEGQKCVTLKPVAVREDASFDSRKTGALKAGTVLEVLELGETPRVRVAAIGKNVEGWVSYKNTSHGQLIVPQLDLAVLDTGVVVEPVFVRDGEDLDSQEIGVLGEGTVLKVLELGQVSRRIRVAALGENIEGWVSFKTLEHEPLVVPEQSYEAARSKGFGRLFQGCGDNVALYPSAMPALATESLAPEAPAPAAAAPAAEPSPDTLAADVALPAAPADAPEAPVAGAEQAAQESAAETEEASAESGESPVASAEEEMGNAPSNPDASADEGLEPYEYFVTEGQKCVALEPVAVREVASFDSRKTGLLKAGTVVEVLELGETPRVCVAAVGKNVEGWVNYKNTSHGPLIVPQLDLGVLDTGVVVEPVFVRNGEDLDSQKIGVLDEGTVLKVLELGQVPRRIRVAALGENTEGWVSFKTLEHEPLVVPEQSYEAARRKGFGRLFQGCGDDVALYPSAMPASATGSLAPEAPAPAAAAPAAEPSPGAPAADLALRAPPADAAEAPVAGAEQAAQESAAETEEALAESGGSPVASTEEEAAGPAAADDPSPMEVADNPARAEEDPAAPEGKPAPAPVGHVAAPAGYDVHPGDTCVAVEAVTVREGESFDSERICELDDGAILGVLEIGRAPRRVRVIVVGTDIQGWVSFKTKDNDRLIVPENQVEVFATQRRGIEIQYTPTDRDPDFSIHGARDVNQDSPRVLIQV